MIKEMWKLLIERNDFFKELLVEHIIISAIVIVIAIVVGGGIGIVISEVNKSVKPTLSVINFLYTIPAISMLGFLIPFSGVGNTTAIIALTIYALLPMVRNTYTGLTNVDPILVEAAKGMGSTNFQILWKVKVPIAMPVIMSGIRSMVTMTIALAGIASFIGAGGLGVAIYRGITINNSAMTILGSLLTALLALFVDFLLGFVDRFYNKKSINSVKRKTKLALVLSLVLVTIVSSLILNRDDDNKIQIATKPMTEQYILGEMLKYVIEDQTDLDVEITHGVGGGTANIHPAMVSGDFDIYPEYTGTSWNAVLKQEGIYTEDMFDYMNGEYNELYDMQWISKYGFNNTYGLAVRSEIAKKYNLKTYSDLKSVSQELVFGAEYDFFEREDGYKALTSAYDLDFKDTKDLDIGLKYDAINQGEIDIMVIFTTDGQLNNSDVIVLEDDEKFYPSYLCGNIIRNEVLEMYPELKTVFESLENIITDAEMAELNYKVEFSGESPKSVAKDFLIKKGILEGDDE